MLLWVTKRSVCDHSSPVCPHNFSFHTLSLYFSCDMSYNSSHLRTNSINFSSISEDNQAGHIASKHSKRSGGDVITAHMIRIEHVGPVPSRQTFSLGGRRRNGTETWRRRSCQGEHLRLTFRSLTTYIYICRTAALTSRRYILNIYSTNIHTEYFKHAA